MGLDIGFNAYRREGDKYLRVKLDDELFPNYMCGRTDLNYRLGNIMSDDEATVCFDADLDGKYMHFRTYDEAGFIVADTQDEYDKDYGTNYNRLSFVDFDNFMQEAEDILKEAEEEIAEEDKCIEKRIADADEYLNKVLAIQLSATDQTAYENAARMVSEARCDLASVKNEVEDSQDNKYRIERTREMLLSMKRLQSLGFLVLPYFSY